MKGKFISLNTRGISNTRKRRIIFTWLRKQKADVIFLQETHPLRGVRSRGKSSGALHYFVLMGPTMLGGLRF